MAEGIFAETIRQAWPLILTAAVTYVNWLILLGLGLQINKIRARKSILLGFTLALAAVDFLGKQAISAQFGFFCAIPLFLLFFKKRCRLSWLPLLVTALVVFSLATFSKIALTGSFRYFHGRFEEYFPYQSLIIISREFSGSLFPGFILLVAGLLDISFTPFTPKRVQAGLLMVGLFTLLIFLTSLLFIKNFNLIIEKDSNSRLLQLLWGQLFMAASMVGLLLLIRSHLIEEKERELDEERLKESKRLLETLASEYREFRNKLQVMDMMVAAGKGEALGRYIQKVAEEISARNQPDYSDPIIKATLLSWRIRARERGISIIEQNNVVPVWPKPQRIAGEILSKALGVLIEEASRLRCNQVIVSGVERAGNSGFQLQISSDEEKSAGIMRIFSLSAERRSPLEDLVAKANGQIEIIADGIIIWLPGRFAEKKMSLRG